MKKLLIISGLLLIFGCMPPRPINFYKISIVSPEGNVKKEINIQSIYKLEVKTNSNGTMYIREKNSYENKIYAIAPVSWYIDYELVKTTRGR